MKKTLIGSIVTLATGLMVYAQGTVDFVNLNGNPALNAPVYLSDGVTKLSGSQYVAELFAGPSADSLSLIATTTFLTGGGAGYFSGGAQAIGTVADGGTAFIQIWAYNTAAGATLSAAETSGQGNAWGGSNIFSVTTGNPGATPPGTPAFLVGLNSFDLNPVPEPATLALMGLGGASLLLFRRRKA